jgi:predicted permease
VDPGYRPQNLLVLGANYSGLSERDGQRALSFFERLRAETASLPGVSAASYALTLPLDPAGSNGNYWIDGHPDPHATALFRAVGPDYFSLLGIPVQEGREIDRRDTADAPRAVVINRAMAQASWPDRSPLGERLRIGWMRSTEQWMTIVGVVADTRSALDRPVRQEIYLPAAQHLQTALSLQIVARTASEPLVLAAELRRRARELDPEVPVVVTTAERRLAGALAAPRFRALLLALFAGAALLLAVLGVAGVMALSVAERRREIGVRMAVGATPRAILGRFLARSLRLAVLGLALGLVAILFAGRLLQALLFGIDANDPRTLVLAAAALLLASLGAAAGPALAAARQSPLSALRVE